MTKPISIDDRIDEILKHFYNRVCSTAGTSFAGDPYTILSKSAKQAIALELGKARIDEIRNFAGYEDDDWQGMTQIPQQRFIERIKALQQGNTHE